MASYGFPCGSSDFTLVGMAIARPSGFFGRSRELAWLLTALERAEQASRPWCWWPVMPGSARPGVLAELADQAAGARTCWLAYAFLVVAAVTEHARHPPPPGMIELTCNEVQHLFAALVCRPAGDLAQRLRWSWWRRRSKPALAPATTAGKPPSNHEDHDLRLEY